MLADAQRLRSIAQTLRERKVIIGTSSWKYQGWLGQLYSPERYEYRGKVAKTRFEADCLAEYGEVFSGVCVDAAHYRFPVPRQLEGLVAQVPEHFRLTFKVADEITLRRFPNLPRHGERAGKVNDNFLNASLFISEFLGPLEPHRDNVGALIFQFPHFYPGDFVKGRDFIDALDEFLGALPRDWQYSVEVRNPAFLRPEYFEMLGRYGVAHTFNSWTRMPSVIEQLAIPESLPTDFAVGRFLLKPGRSYEAAVTQFSPYNRIQEEYPDGREGLEKLVSAILKKPRERYSYVFINNRFEGNALQSILATLSEYDLAPPVPEEPKPPEDLFLL